MYLTDINTPTFASFTLFNKLNNLARLYDDSANNS